jgi:CRP/FNR family cyclic AMP-dependent transcriptional regulator
LRLVEDRDHVMTQAPQILHAVTLFQDLDADALSALARLMNPQKINSGNVVFQELDESDALYIIQEGTVVVSKHVRDDVDIVLTRFGPGDFFGEMGLFDAAPRSATAHAEVDSILWRLDRSIFHDTISHHPDIAAKICYRLVAVFIERLRATNEQAREAVRWGLEATGYAPAGGGRSFGRKST